MKRFEAGDPTVVALSRGQGHFVLLDGQIIRLLLSTLTLGSQMLSTRRHPIELELFQSEFLLEWQWIMVTLSDGLQSLPGI